jgi:hypothetical protein
VGKLPTPGRASPARKSAACPVIIGSPAWRAPGDSTAAWKRAIWRGSLADGLRLTLRLLCAAEREW